MYFLSKKSSLRFRIYVFDSLGFANNVFIRRIYSIRRAVGSKKANVVSIQSLNPRIG